MEAITFKLVKDCSTGLHPAVTYHVLATNPIHPLTCNTLHTNIFTLTLDVKVKELK